MDNILKDKKRFFDLLEKSIIEVISLEGNKYPKEGLKISEYKNKYSNLESPSTTLFYGDNPLNSRKHRITYECGCSNISSILLVKFLKKTTLHCSKCRETEEKRRRHSELLRSKDFKKKIKPVKFYNLDEHIKTSVKNFNNEDEIFIKKYFNKNLTELEFNKFKDKIVSVNNKSVIGKSFVFLPILEVKNQTKYSQYFLIDNEKVSLKNIQFKCDNCGDVFNTTRKLKEKVNNYKMLCSKCGFCNKTFKLRKYVTKFNDSITYQSKIEKMFIIKCEELNIRILDGLTISYLYKDTEHKYRVDFLLPDYKILIEIKGNHIWHRQQLESGVWGIKQRYAELYSTENNLTYKLLFQEDIDVFLNLLRYSLAYDENHRS